MNFEKNKTIYLQIADYVFEQILLKQWTPGEKIPSVRDMAVSIEVNPNTVVRAYAYLETKGIIEMQRGIGYFISGAAFDRVIELKRQEFLSKDLPQFFKSINLLGLEIKDILQQYRKMK